MKLMTYVVPCYNSEAYMRNCISTLLASGGEELEIILVDDGSMDGTGRIADEYAARYPEIVRAIHQENGGHGEGVNQGIRNARGLYFKVVDSDDWLDVPSAKELLATIRRHLENGSPADLYICNYVYEHETQGSRVMRYRSTLPVGRIFGWSEIRSFKPWQYLLMHSLVYRTALLRECGLELPKHTFYVDNLFAYIPLPYVKTLCYLDLDLYRYYIGREDQSVNEAVMIRRIDQQLRVTRLMAQAYRGERLAAMDRKLVKYLLNYVTMMMTISSVLLTVDGSPEALEKRAALWSWLKAENPGWYSAIRYRSIATFVNLPGAFGRRLSVQNYRLARRIYKFN
ncbi:MULTISPECIES: glycosyltransferase family 2 protein [Anaerotruncus]|uniref:glycosyltransferase family 2 protein n=1 Tax=Anaerotruncus TaxID=244127 RepID=UPI0020811B22|nr:glycosyltransferase family 2 protein [Anaerotruncus massiliensis (ex Togo et al. 2019)]GKH46562.1 glycosyl transferase [Oscillospiraceae bacterium]